MILLIQQNEEELTPLTLPWYLPQYSQNVQNSLWCQNLKLKLNAYINNIPTLSSGMWHHIPTYYWKLLPPISPNITHPEERGSRFCQTRYLHTQLHGITSTLFDHRETRISNDQFVTSSTVSLSSECIMCWTDITKTNLTYTSLQTSSSNCWGL